ncbi:hypothetical protein P691DRAFT_776317 [Macrolepiota fuliginosa MF-IS2]|uniref:DUF7904 domain-containing protein n=1 Tax=Macrolepiota fuliginosa MF-IS2 TaxID=1400762 RepID=A0A9P5X9J6_9AGAR|nr:hypothetical protein P691DRAFT_776317 [Macrolepiota fuliginosa MF-IS2]
MEPVTPSRRGTFDLPKPETGLAEWTSKIKALQRQVDADEEAEQKRLEEEITMARRARLRRSRGAGYGDSVDLSTSPSVLGIPSSRLSKSPSEVPKTLQDRQNDQDDALRKLAGASSSNVDTSSITQGLLPRLSQFPAAQPPPSQRPDPVSLASFIGGRATGPRLNRHAPQQDVHDPTQFEQRTNNTPHPIFGKGGVAMPGMVTKAGNSVRDAMKASEAVERYQPRLAKRTSTPSLAKQPGEVPTPRSVSPQKTGSRDRTLSTPSVAKKYLEQIEQRPVSPQKTGSRERTYSTPAPPPPASKSIDNNTSRPTITRSAAEAPVAAARPKTPSKDRLSSTPSRVFAEKPSTPRHVPTIVNIPASPTRSSISTPSLARAILPDSRLPSQAPVAPSNTIPTAAFHKPPPQKDITPSISRLQGRGFVQNMVRASTELENSVKSTPGSPASRPSSGRKSTVLDRWQPNTASPSPTPTFIPRQSSPVRKSYSELGTRSDFPVVKSPIPAPATPAPVAAKALKPKTSHPLLHPDPLVPQAPLSPRRAKLAEKMLPPEGSPGFGSATTMVVYKPKAPETPPEEAAPTPSVDELGVRRDPSSDTKGKPRFSVPSELPAPTGKPLNHPTKERARKPKKNRDVSGGPSPIKSFPESIGDVGLPRRVTRSPQLPRTPPPQFVGAPPPPSASSHGESNSTQNSADLFATREPVSKVAHITQKWGQAAPIGVKSIASPPAQAQVQIFQPEIKPKPDSNLIRRALPGMTPNDGSLRAPSVPTKSKSPSPESTLQVSNSTPLVASSRDASPSSTSGYDGSTSSTEGYPKSSSPVKSGGSDRPPKSPSSPKHTRIPSTGSRALVMDVAQALNEYNASLPSESSKPQEEVKSPIVETTVELTARPRHTVPPSLERRRSSYDRFSAVSVMPPLKEEATPNGTPFGTLTRTPDTHSREVTLNTQVATEGKLRDGGGKGKDVVHFDIDDTPLPSVDVSALLQSQTVLPLIPADVQTISVDVLAVNGVSLITISRDTNIFYDSETLVIVHRYKSKSTGLVSTQLWAWYGKKSQVGEKEARKLQELEKRYNTSATIIHQNSEPPHLVQLLGGELIIRQGNRLHWLAENTAMYSIRKLGGVLYIDEHEPSIKNLCSGFSYCLTILDAIYVWHGCGSTDEERQAAVQYASRIGNSGSSAIQLREGEDDDDELFWMALGDEEFARADYWQWRRQSSGIDPRVWRVDAKANPPVVAVAGLREEAQRDKSVYIIDCVWEHFIVVGHKARGDRTSIKLALSTAKHLSEASASSRPFTPTVHVLVLPSRLPADLRLNLRELDDDEANYNKVPDHMNLLSSTQAECHLQQASWERTVLQDPTMLPLGVSAPDTQ